MRTKFYATNKTSRVHVCVCEEWAVKQQAVELVSQNSMTNYFLASVLHHLNYVLCVYNLSAVCCLTRNYKTNLFRIEHIMNQSKFKCLKFL